MVEAPRIRIIYDKIRFTKNKTIMKASGASYKKVGINLEGYLIRKWWFAGKYIYFMTSKEGAPTYIVRTHMMMYGKITINEDPIVNPKLTPFLVLELDDGTILKWYLSQIKFLDPNCETDLIKSNYTTCSSKQSILDSIQMSKYDISNKNYNEEEHMKHLLEGMNKFKDQIIMDFLLDQKYFPGVGNILQQEVLYRCKILPTKKLVDISVEMIHCLVKELRNVINLLYQSYLDKLEDKPHQPIFQIYHKGYCPLGHKTITKYLGYHNRRTTWCPICQV